MEFDDPTDQHRVVWYDNDRDWGATAEDTTLNTAAENTNVTADTIDALQSIVTRRGLEDFFPVSLSISDTIRGLVNRVPHDGYSVQITAQLQSPTPLGAGVRLLDTINTDNVNDVNRH